MNVAIKCLDQLNGHVGSVECLITNPFRGWLISGDDEGYVIIWNEKDRTCIQKFCVHKGNPILVLCITKNGSLLHVAVGCKYYQYQMGEKGEAQLIRIQSGFKEEISDMALNENDTYLVVADDNGEIHIQSLIDPNESKIFKTRHENICSKVSFRPNRPSEVVSCGMDCTLIRWNSLRGTPLKTYQAAQLLPRDLEMPQMLNPPFVTSLQFSEMGNTIIAGTGSGTILLIHSSSKRPSSKEFIYSFQAHPHYITDLCYLNQSKLLLSVGFDQRLRVWSLDSSLEIKTSPSPLLEYHHSCKINTLCASSLSSETLFYLADEHTTIHLFQIIHY